MKVADLSGLLLDWAVCKCIYPNLHPEGTRHIIPSYSTEWEAGGPIIEREKIDTWFRQGTGWCAAYFNSNTFRKTEWASPTPLIAAMRCYVASRLGDEVDIPEALK